MKKKFLVGGVFLLLVVGVFFFLRGPHSSAERGFRVSFVGFTNETLGPHALLLLHKPEGAAAASSVRRMKFTDNYAFNTAQSGFIIVAGRDSVFEGNVGVKANLYTAVSAFNTSMRVGVAGNTPPSSRTLSCATTP